MPFQPFSKEHFVAVGIGALVVWMLILIGRRGGNGRLLATAVLVFVNLSSYGFSQAAWMSLGGKMALDNILPFHLCDIAAVLAGFALLTKRPLLCSLTFFWGLAATFQALLTPALGVGFPSWPFIMFFIQHFAIVATALYLPLVEGWRPPEPIWKGPLQAYVWSIVYILFALGINTWLGTNFGFANRPPDNPSLIDHLGPWPWYLVSMQAIAVVLFLLLALAFRRKEPG